MNAQSPRKRRRRRPTGPGLSSAQKASIGKFYEELNARDRSLERWDRRLFHGSLVVMCLTALGLASFVAAAALTGAELSADGVRLLVGGGAGCGSTAFVCRLLHRRVNEDREKDRDLTYARAVFVARGEIVPSRRWEPPPGAPARGRRKRRPRTPRRTLGALRRFIGSRPRGVPGRIERARAAVWPVWRMAA